MLSSRIARGLVAALVAISPLLLSSCQNSLTDNLLEAEQPTLIDPSNVDSPAGADAIRLGTLINFRNITNVWTFGGLVGDEFDFTSPAGITLFVDQRRGTNPFAISAFTSQLRTLATIRTSVNQAVPLLVKWAATPVANIASFATSASITPTDHSRSTRFPAARSRSRSPPTMVASA